LRLIFLTPFAEYDFFKPIEHGMKDAAKAMNVDAKFGGPKDGNLQELAAMIRKAIRDGYDGIAVNITDPNALDEAISEATAKGVPVVAFNVDDNGTPNARLSAVCQDFLAAGRSLGQRAAKFVPDNSHVLVTKHEAGVSALDDRARGAEDVLRQHGVTWEELVTGSDRNVAMERIRAALAAEPTIRVILSTGSADTEAAGLVVEDEPSESGFESAGFDLSPEILRLVKHGVIRFTIDQQPYIQGYYPVLQLAFYLRYGIKPSNIDSGAIVINAEDVEKVAELNKRQFR
jgi:simple sugar transport system substrate-binding protein